MADWYRKRQPTRTRIVFTHPTVNIRDGTQSSTIQYSALRQRMPELVWAHWARMAHTEDHNTGVIHSSDMSYQGCDVDPKSATLLCHWTRSCVVHACSRCGHPSGAAEPYGKGAGPWHCHWLHWPAIQMSMPYFLSAEDRLYATAYAGRTAASHSTRPALWCQYGSGADPAPCLGARPWHDGPVRPPRIGRAR